MTVSCDRAVTGSWYSVRRNGRQNKVTEVKGGVVSAIKSGKVEGQREINKKGTERTEINEVLK